MVELASLVDEFNALKASGAGDDDAAAASAAPLDKETDVRTICDAVSARRRRCGPMMMVWLGFVPNRS